MLTIIIIIIIIITITIIAPAGISPRRRNPEDATYSSNIQSYSQYRKNLDCLNRGLKESVGNDDVSFVCARKYEMVRMT